MNFIFLQTLYVWDSTQEQRMNTNFQNVVACRYRDAMRMFRIKSALKAIKDGHPISAKGRNFDIMVHYVPRGMQSERWVELCKVSGLKHFCYLLLFSQIYINL